MNKRNIVIPCRAAFLHCFQPFSFAKDGSNAKYMVTGIVSKNDTRTIKTVNDAISEAIEAGIRELWNGKRPSNLHIPFKDGDEKEENKENFENAMYFTAKSTTAPEVVDQRLKPIFNEDKIYSGCFVNVSLSFKPYNAGANKGISIFLHNIQLVKSAERFSGRPRAVDEFHVIPCEEESSEFEEISEFENIDGDE